MLLKHVLNHEIDEDDYPHHRKIEGWNEQGVPVDVTPALQDLAWDDYVADLLNPERAHSISSPNTDVGAIENDFLLFSHEQFEQIEKWAAENAPSQTPSSPQTSGKEEEQICYGMIYRSSVKLRGEMAELINRLSSGGGHPMPGHYQLSITRHDDQFVVTFQDGSLLGEVNIQLQKALASISGKQLLLDLEVFAPIIPIRETINRATKEKDAVVRVNINVYGSRAAITQIGREFSTHKVYLQKPDYRRPSCTYDNPHVLRLANFQPEYNQPAVDNQEEQPGSEANPTEQFKKTISTIYSSLIRGRTLNSLEGDARLKTRLLPHQKQALDFMSQRETGPIPDSFCLWKRSEVEGKPCFHHVITDAASYLPPPETGGGILADEMGMGKTLSILSLMLRTRDKAHHWASEPPNPPNDGHGNKQRLRTRATLIIASSDLMINEWLQEIGRHFDRQVREDLKTIKYHGTNRESDTKKLRDADLVITTYHTLWSDCQDSKRDKSQLNGLEWYRLVLDEAHIVRRQSTVLYRSVAGLQAQSRWCLTGTPIQNKLEDIGSLFAFLRISPFHTLANFRKHIVVPFDDGGKRREVAITKFTQLLDSLCLRRTKDLLNLPAQNDIIRNIELSAEERTQYDNTSNMMWRAARNQVGGLDQKSTLGMFQIQLQLRILCNHGTYQQPFSWKRRKLQFLKDEREAIEALVGRECEVTCSICKETLPLIGSGSAFQRFTEQCRHVLCSECVQDAMAGIQASLPTICPICSQSCRPHPPFLNRMHAGEGDGYFRLNTGKSSKMEALMRDVGSNNGTTKRCVGAHTTIPSMIDLSKKASAEYICSIIFSCWTHTLDLIAIYLRHSCINFERIDGECPTSMREKILDKFTSDIGLRVLIMTTGTGAVGLNLATANRVFIVEPQWNPSVENQAIARALRLGQDKPVQVTRYVVSKTVEQDMRSLQDRKLEMAEMVKC